MSISSEIARIKQNIASVYEQVAEKGGTLPLVQNSSNLPDAIESIPTGSSCGGEDVIFYDYDGTVVQTYSATEFASLSSMPSNPSHTGLTAQGWNWTLADAKAYVAEHGKLDIGQMYVTSDNKTRLYITLNERLEPYLGIGVLGTATINWGDGTTDTITGNSAGFRIYTKHTYSTKGDYTITISCDNKIGLGGDSTYGGIITAKNNSTINRNAIYLNSLKNVELGNNVVFDTNAFYKCTNLSTITIPNTVTSISTNCFINCYNLEMIVIPNSVIGINSSVFQNCSNLKNISLPNSVTNIDGSCFSGCTSLKGVTLPNSLTQVGTNLFYNCYNLIYAKISNSLIKMNNNMFNGCSLLKEIKIPNSVTEFGYNVFFNCLSLESISMSNNVTIFGYGCFSQCKGLKEVTLSNNLTSLSTEMFNQCASLENITLPSGITSFGNSVFSGCFNLKSINLPSSLTSFGRYCFGSCYLLQSISIPNGVTIINDSDFYECMNIKELTLSQNTQQITAQAFSNCYSLSKIIFPSTITSIGYGAFQACYGMKIYDFSAAASIPTLSNSNALAVNTDTAIIVPDSLYNDWKVASNWSMFANNIISKSDWDAQN